MNSLGFDLVFCARCGHRYATETFAPEDLAAEYYNESTEDIELRSLEAKRKRFAEYLAQIGEIGKRPGRVLDVGCNAGELLALFQAAGWEVAGVEPSPGPAMFARRRLGAPIWNGLVEEVLPDGESFDLITMTHVLEHIERPGLVIDRMKRALRPGGMLLLEVPNADDVLLRAWGGIYRPLCPGDHVSFFDESSLRRLLSTHGFAVQRISSPTHSWDIVYASLLSAVDWVRNRNGTMTRGGVRRRDAGALPRPLAPATAPCAGSSTSGRRCAHRVPRGCYHWAGSSRPGSDRHCPSDIVIEKKVSVRVRTTSNSFKYWVCHD